MQIITGLTYAKSGITLMARIVGQGGTPITMASLAAITYAVRDQITGNITSGTLVIASSVFDTLQQNDPRWITPTGLAIDSPQNPGIDGLNGYNFLTVLPAATFTNLADIDPRTQGVVPHPIVIDVTFTPQTGQPFHQQWTTTPAPTWP